MTWFSHPKFEEQINSREKLGKFLNQICEIWQTEEGHGSAQFLYAKSAII